MKRKENLDSSAYRVFIITLFFNVSVVFVLLYFQFRYLDHHLNLTNWIG